MSQDMQKLAYIQSRSTADQSTRCLLAAFAYLGVPQRFYDLGCGDGHLCVLAARLGAVVGGIDLHLEDTAIAALPVEHGKLLRGSIDEWSNPYGPADMVICLEVAEHLPPEAAPALCDTLVACLRPEGILLFSAAQPGQGGAGHVNERPVHYWVDMLERRGMGLIPPITNKLRTIWTEVAPTAWWYGQNLAVLRNGGL